MSYLITNDYKRLIQSDNLQQVIGYDAQILTALHNTAVAEMISYLRSRYDTAREFTDTLRWDENVAYKRLARVYLDATAYNASIAYTTGQQVLQAGNVYSSKVGSPAGAFDAAQWDLLGAQYDMFYVPLPYLEFNYKTLYNVNDYVWYKDRVYQCRRKSTVPSHEQTIQTDIHDDLYNVFPDDTVYGVQQWGTGSVYTPVAGIIPTDTNKWAKGDNRNPQMVLYCIDIALYHIHKRISPRNIPDLRVKAYDDAKNWLKMASTGKDITADLIAIQPRQGGRIRYGGNPKLRNTY